MQFDSSARRSKILQSVNQTKASTTYKWISGGESNLSMYDCAPKEEISLHDFEEIAAQRLKALRKIEELKQRHATGTYDELRASLQKELLPLFPVARVGAGIDKESLRRSDVIGHFALRLAFCRSPEDTKWFVNHEVELFRFRFQNESKSAVIGFFKDNNFAADLMSPSEKESCIEDLANSSCLSPDQVRSTDFWKMDALDALELVRKRKVLLISGNVYLPYSQLITIIIQRLRTTMNAAMARANRFIGVIEEQNRLIPRLERLTKGGYGGKEYNANDGDKITRFQIDSAAKQLFPLCMSACHSHLRKNHHFKHGARRQYGLFLKAIGLSLDEALAFFRDEFSQKMDSDKFDKQYSYNIRHMYGKEGNRKDYPAFSCANIILHNAPSHDDCHGCPFKHSTESTLKSLLRHDNIPHEHVEEMIALTKLSQYDKACTLHWEILRGTGPGSMGTLVTHPNQYYEMAREANGKKKIKEVVPIKEEKVEVKEEEEESMDTQ